MAIAEAFSDDEVLGLEIELPEDDEGDLDEAVPETGPVKVSHKKRYANYELEEMADALLREDANRELCRVCRDADSTDLPYGHETGHVEWQLQYDNEGDALLDEAGEALYVGFPELKCPKGHRWYKGEGPRRNINGKDAILFETHLYNRRRREIQVKEGVPDPAYTMDRWGKRPTTGLYNRTHPQGRKVNTKDQSETWR